MKKRLLSILLAAALVCATPAALATEGEPVFSDVPAGSWFEEGVATCARQGVMVGRDGGAFAPDAILTAVECLTLAVRLYDLRHGGDGSIEHAPEEWGRMTLTLADGTVFEGYGERGEPFTFWMWAKNDYWALCVDLPGETDEERRAWGLAHEGAATLTIGETEFVGTVICSNPIAEYVLMFRPDDPTKEDYAAIQRGASSDIPGPERWYRDVVYTAHQLGLNDGEAYPAFAALLGDFDLESGAVAVREKFALALAEAAGELEPLYTVERLFDLEREGNEPIFALYDAGVLTGTDEYGTFDADGYLTRAQAAVMVARVLDEKQRVTTPPKAGGPYEKAVAELRNEWSYVRASERTYETDLCIIFVYDRGGMMYAPRGNVTLIYKAGAPLGEGTVVHCPGEKPYHHRESAEVMGLSADETSFVYSYYYEDKIQTYTVDLATGETATEEIPMTYDGALTFLTQGVGYTVEERLEAPAGTVALRWKELSWTDDTRDYQLWMACKDEGGTLRQFLLPSTILREGGYYRPTHIAPDSLSLNEDGSELTYVYHFEEALVDGEETLHEAGTYTYTVELATGELTVTHKES